MKHMVRYVAASKMPSFRSRDAVADNVTGTLRIRRSPAATHPILIVEDEFLIAADLEAQIREDGGKTARLALSIDAAEQELKRGSDLAGVILDVNVGGTTTFGLADALMAAGMPFVFFTGYRSISIPDRFVGVPRIAKPASWRELQKGLAKARERLLNTGLGSFRDSVEAALPRLRSHARSMAKSHEDADQLVERTLERAISAVGNRSLRLTIEDWLLSLLERTNKEGDGRILH
jgi:DNA-binding LytR/AlgR family response regulator